MISLKVRPTISIENLFSIGVSSHMIKDTSRNNFVVLSYFEKPKKLVSLGFNGKINRECVVRPPNSITAVTPDVGANAIKRFDLTCASNVR